MTTNEVAFTIYDNGFSSVPDRTVLHGIKTLKDGGHIFACHHPFLKDGLVHYDRKTISVYSKLKGIHLCSFQRGRGNVELFFNVILPKLDKYLDTLIVMISNVGRVASDKVEIEKCAQDNITAMNKIIFNGCVLGEGNLPKINIKEVASAFGGL